MQIKLKKSTRACLQLQTRFFFSLNKIYKVTQRRVGCKANAPFLFQGKGRFVMAEMTKIEIITRQSKLEELKTALNEIGINGMTVTNVMGYGVQKGQRHHYRGVEYNVDLLPKVKVEMVVCTVPVDDVVNTAVSVLRTGEIGDGKIFISPVSRVIKVRTGEEDKDALL